MALETFGERLRVVRMLWGMTQSDIQRAGGPSRNTISRWENALEHPSNSEEETLLGLASALKCNLPWLLTGTGPMWAEGITPPRGGEEAQMAPQPVHVASRPDPELGRYILNGPVDCAVMWRAHELVQDYVQYGWESFNHPEGIWLVYKFLAKEKDPLGPISHEALNTVLALVQ